MFFESDYKILSNEKIAMILGISLEEIEDILVTQKLILK